ncbi:MAG TPA: hypothetical protein VGN81_09940 [Pseudonocardiaceae bacterium]
MSTPQQPGQGQPPFGAQPGQFGQPGQGQQGQFGQPAPQAPGQFGQPGQFPGQGGPAAGQGPAFPAAGQGPAFPASGQGTGFPQQGQATFGPAQGGGGGFGPAMPSGGGGRMRRAGRVAGRALMIRLIVLGVVIVVGLVVWLFTKGSDPGNAAVGDCIGNLPTVNSTSTVDANNAKKIDCTDSSAQYKVIGVKNDPSGNEINNSDQVDKDCSAYPGYQVAFEQYSQDNSGDNSDGTLLCLEPVKH